MTDLAHQLAQRIVEKIRADGIPEGHHLREQPLADEFRVSRHPVREALSLLAQDGVVEQRPNRGFFVIKGADRLRKKLTVPELDKDEEPYLAIAEDRLAGRLPDRVSENELMRRYDLTKGQLSRILSRMVRESWIERLPGHGWGFLPMLTSVEAYEAGYRFRATIEPAAILEPTFKIDEAAFRRLREQQQALLDGDLRRLPGSRLFQINSEFHETLTACSNNAFFIDAIKRVNRSRRLIEYRKFVDRERLVGQCREHLHILDLIESGDRHGAAKFLFLHLSTVRVIKIADSGIDAPANKPAAKVRAR